LYCAGFDYRTACHPPPPLAEVLLESGPCEREIRKGTSTESTSSLSSIFSSVDSQAALNSGDSGVSDLVAWTKYMRDSCAMSDASPCCAPSDIDHQRAGEEERGGEERIEEGGQGHQTQAPHSHQVPFIVYYAMATLLSSKQGGVAGGGAEAATHQGTAGAAPSIGTTVKATSSIQGAPPGCAALGFSAGQKLRITQVRQYNGKWYAIGHEFSTLWFPLSSTDWVGVETPAFGFGTGGKPSSFGAPGAAASSDPTPVKWRARLDEAAQKAMLLEVKASLSALQEYLESRAADDFDQEDFLSQLAAVLSRLSVVTLHLLKLLPLAVLSEFDSSSGAELRGYEGEAAASPTSTFRSLMSVALRLMLRQHKAPLITEILRLDSSSARHSMQEVKIDRFQALKDCGERLQHTVLAQIHRQLGAHAKAMRGDTWWKVSFVGMQVEKNDDAQEDDPEFEKFAQANRMRRCPRCQAWVQKTDGCDAIHCLCNLVFCYLCAGVLNPGQGIKQCKCPGVPGLLRQHEGARNHNMRPEVEAAW